MIQGKEYDQQIFHSIETVLKKPTGTVPFKCNPHLLTEKYLKNNKKFKQNFKMNSLSIPIKSNNIKIVKYLTLMN